MVLCVVRWFSKNLNKMGYRGKLMVEHTRIKLPKEIAEKYKDDYHIAQLENGDYVVDISSKFETEGHWDILLDLKELLKDNNFGIYGVVLWEDGRIDRHNFSTGEQETFKPKDDY